MTTRAPKRARSETAQAGSVVTHADWPADITIEEADWWAVVLDAEVWFGRTSVPPLAAALLLCCFDPSDASAETQARVQTTDRTEKRDFVRLLEYFVNEIDAAPPLKLSQWLHLATEAKLKVHPWAAAYHAARAAANLPVDVEVKGLSLTTDDVCAAFDGLGMSRLDWRRLLSKDRPAWLRKCRASIGRRGRGGAQSRWFPVLIAGELLKGTSRKADEVSTETLRSAFNTRPLLRDARREWLEWIEANHAD